MPNNLTGDYEAVVQVSVRQINGLLQYFLDLLPLLTIHWHLC